MRIQAQTPKFEVRFTDDAVNELQSIHAYVRDNGGQKAADNLVEQVKTKIDLLKQTPFIGVAPIKFPFLMGLGYRLLPCGKYWIIYFVFPELNIVEIHHIVHQRRDLNALI